MMNRFFVVLSVLLMGILIACSSGEEATRGREEVPPPTESPRKTLLSQSESTFNPADFDEPVETVLQTHKARQLLLEVGNADSTYVETEYMQGFRIQIFATANIDEANAMKLTAAEQVVDDSLYVVYDPPVYKVRIGDFKTRREANQKLDTLVDKGFPDAWIVNDRIVQQKIVRIRLK